jgi:DNA-binding XRE family transcriptional regulator
MTIQIIRNKKGSPAYAVVPWADYIRLSGEDAEDLALAAMADAVKARKEESVPSQVADRLLAGEAAVKVLREWRGLTQNDLAKKTGLAKLYISQLENGRARPGRKALTSLAKALGLGVDALLDYL